MTRYAFVPPVRKTLPRTVPRNHPGNLLMRHFAPGDVGVNVFILADGTVTEADPGGTNVAPYVTLHGGHTHYVTEAQRLLLLAAGYTVTLVPDEIPSVGLWGYGEFDTPGSVRDPNADTTPDNLLDTGLDGLGSDQFGSGPFGGSLAVAPVADNPTFGFWAFGNFGFGAETFGGVDTP